jgi:hypothetical protein
MSGKVIAIGLILFAVVFGVALWWAQDAYYERVDGLTSVTIAGADVPVSAYRGLDGASSPLKLRACFTVDPAAVQGPEAPDAVPLATPDWFDCYDPPVISADLRAGRARAVVAGEDPAGFVRIVAVRPDGRAFMWRQPAEALAP